MDNKHYDAHYLNNTFEVMKGIKWNSYQLLNDSKGTIVDVGCGTGMDVAQLAKIMPNNAIIGMDHDNKLVSHAQNSFQADNITFINGSVLALPFPNNSISAFRAERVFQHVVEDIVGFQQIHEKLISNGLFVILETDWSSILFQAFPKPIDEKMNHYLSQIKVVNGNICNLIVKKLQHVGFNLISHEIQKLHTQTYQDACQFLMIETIFDEIINYPNLLSDEEIKISKKIMERCKNNNRFVATLNFHTLKVSK